MPLRLALPVALAACLIASQSHAQEAPSDEAHARAGQPELPTYQGGYDGFGRFGNAHGYKGYGRDGRFRGQDPSWSDRSTTVASGTIGLAYGLSMGPYAGEFVERFGYPDGGGRSRPAIPDAPAYGRLP